MSNLNEVKKNKLDVAELSEKIKNLATELKSELGDEFMDKLKKLVQKKVDYLAYAYILCIVLLVVIFVFFGYKLYKSLADRERRKEEKRRQKQQKKKK
jgi:ATP/ADP translocase